MSNTAYKVAGCVGIVCMAACALVCMFYEGCTSMIECTSGSVYMKCHWTFIAAAPLALLGIVGFALALAVKGVEARRVVLVLVLLTLVIIALLPTDLLIGLCAHADSGCHTKAYIVWATSALAFVVGAVMLAKADPDEAAKPKLHQL